MDMGVAGAASIGGVVDFDAPGASGGTLRGTASIAIDTSGNIAGIYSGGTGIVHSFLRSSGGVITAFEAPAAQSGANLGTAPIGFDAAGDLVGIFLDANKVFHGFVRSAKGTIVAFDVPGAGTGQYQGSFPTLIDAQGNILGSYVDSKDVIHGFRRSASGTFVTFAIPGEVGGAAVSMNTAGTIVGSYVDNDNVGHGFMRNPATGTISTVDAPGAGSQEGQGTFVLNIDTAGDVAGAYVDLYDVVHGFLRSASGTFSVFSAPGAGIGTYQGTFPLVFGASGEIAGTYLDSNNVGHGFLRSATGALSSFNAPGASPVAVNGLVMIRRSIERYAIRSNRARGFSNIAKRVSKSLGNFLILSRDAMADSGGVFNGTNGVLNGTGSFAINGTGQIAGLYFDANSVAHGFLRSASGSLTIADAPGAGTGAYQGTIAYLVNPSGTIAGTYLDKNLVFHGFVATLAEVPDTVTLTSTAASLVYGQSVTLTAKVASSGGVPSDGETIWFMEGGKTLATVPLSNGVATFSTTALSAGANSITAVYGGDANFAGMTSNALNVSVSKASSSTYLTSKPSPSSFAQLVTFKAGVTGPYGGTPTGTITFYNGSTIFSVQVLKGGAARLSTASLPLATNVLKAVYSGDTNFSASTSAPLSQSVNQATPTITWYRPAAIPYGTPLSAAQLNAIASVPGTLVYSPPAGTLLPTGSQTLSVTFTPSDKTDYTTATGTVLQVVTAAATIVPTVKVTTSATSITTAQVLEVTVAVSGASGKPAPTGSVLLTRGSYRSRPTVLESGAVTVEIPAGSLAVGTGSLTATYTPDAYSNQTYESAAYTSPTITVKAATTLSGTVTALTLTSASSSVSSVASGSVVTFSAKVSAGTTTLTTGQVNFCDATAAFCTDVHLLGTAQITKNGSAVLKFRPSIGSHRYKAVFVGTHSQTASTSSIVPLIVTQAGRYASTATVSQSGVAGNYTLTATVAGQGPAAPTGTLSFLDTSYGSVLGTAVLSPAASALSWSYPQAAATGENPTAITTGDFNLDGIPDLAVANAGDYTNNYTGSLTILLGAGDGTFNAATSPAMSIAANSLAVGDFNGDGIPDLAVVTQGNYTNNYMGSVTILLGKGDGTFTAISPSAATGNDLGQLVIGDFNGDGIPDLAVLHIESNTITILLGNGDGTFTATATSPESYSPSSLAVGDFNGDGILDLAVTNLYSNSVSILLGKGDGTFTAMTTSQPTGAYPNAVAVGDFNGDGIADLAVTDGDDNTVRILIGRGDGTFRWATTLVENNPQFVAVGDFNGDGIPDLVVSNPWGASPTIFLGNGDGAFKGTSTEPAISGPLALGDFNGDGTSDLAATNNMNNTVATALAHPSSATAKLGAVSVAGLGPHLAAARYPGDENYNSKVSATTPLYAPTTAPVISLAGGTYTSVQMLAITDATPGAII